MFYKRDGETLLTAPNFVIGPDFELRAETYYQHEYPVNGWYWFAEIEEAIEQLGASPGESLALADLSAEEPYHPLAPL